MNLHVAYVRRGELNEKMSRMLLARLRDERDRYLVAIANYPPDRMARFGQPMLDQHEEKIRMIEALIEEKFS